MLALWHVHGTAGLPQGDVRKEVHGYVLGGNPDIKAERWMVLKVRDAGAMIVADHSPGRHKALAVSRYEERRSKATG